MPMLPSCGNDEKSCYKYLCAGFCVDITYLREYDCQFIGFIFNSWGFSEVSDYSWFFMCLDVQGKNLDRICRFG